MARHSSTKDFFRQMPNPQLARFYQGRGLFGGLDFAAIPDGKPDKLFAAWLELPQEQRHAMDAEFQDIFEMSGGKGFPGDHRRGALAIARSSGRPGGI